MRPGKAHFAQIHEALCRSCISYTLPVSEEYSRPDHRPFIVITQAATTTGLAYRRAGAAPADPALHADCHGVLARHHAFVALRVNERQRRKG